MFVASCASLRCGTCSLPNFHRVLQFPRYGKSLGFFLRPQYSGALCGAPVYLAAGKAANSLCKSPVRSLLQWILAVDRLVRRTTHEVCRIERLPKWKEPALVFRRVGGVRGVHRHFAVDAF